jgi:hypothetical protein
MGIRTEREIHAEFEGAKIYRRLYEKKQMWLLCQTWMQSCLTMLASCQYFLSCCWIFTYFLFPIVGSVFWNNYLFCNLRKKSTCKFVGVIEKLHERVYGKKIS